MNLSRWHEVKRLVQEALELPPEERDAYLAAVADVELRREAAALLAIPSERVGVFDGYRPLLQSPFAPLLSEGRRIGDYAIIRPLGAGGMGAVYLARDSRHERQVALKILTPLRAGLAADEHKALARLNHPNIATLYESGTTDEGLRYVAMEYVEGLPLGAFCERHCPSLRSRLTLFRKVCAAVSYAHQHLVVHRDLKPSNILVTPEGEPKLLDFGIAKLLPTGLEDATLTSPEERCLTLAFASPEQLGHEHTSTATDIYALGVLLNLLLTGCLPYRARSLHELPWAIRNSDPMKPSDLIRSPADEKNGHQAGLFLGPSPPEGRNCAAVSKATSTPLSSRPSGRKPTCGIGRSTSCPRTYAAISTTSRWPPAAATAAISPESSSDATGGQSALPLSFWSSSPRLRPFSSSSSGRPPASGTGPRP